ncbi:MAG: PDC sensor domain-containing protein [Alcanivoracaceae bacterium]|nr:PDC sensor domain-containing protein [Alcanivoracaceae bacterium]
MRAAILFLLMFMSVAATSPSMSSSVTPSRTYTQELARAHEAHLLTLANSPNLRAFLEQKKEQTSSLKKILTFDKRWATDDELRSSVTDNTIARQFQRLLDDDRYGIAEIMLTDGFGSLLAARPEPSDYWQGDEEKFYAPVQSSDTYVSKAAWDESSRTNSFFISIPIESNGEFIGVLIAGLKITQEYMMHMPIEELFRLRAQ